MGVDWTFFIENQSFFDNFFDRYPIGEKTEVADSEKRTPEAKFGQGPPPVAGISQKGGAPQRFPGSGLASLVPRASNPHFFLRDGNFLRIRKKCRFLRMPQSRRFERPRSSRSQHSNPGGARCLSSASVAQMLAAASIKVMDALFGFPAQNDAECYKRELLGRSWRRDWAMRRFRPP